jgi:hypothetical protein
MTIILTKDDGLTTPHSQPAKPHTNFTTNDLDFPTGDRPSKVLATIKAQFALRGHSVHDGGNHDFIVVQTNWGHSRHCQDYAALIVFGRQLGVL